MARTKGETPKPTGRPSEFAPEIANAICERLISGESLRAICRDEEMPGQTTVYRWLISEGDDFDAFRKQYAHAREVQGEVYADRLVDEALTASDAAIGRLKMDALKWAASKLAPKKYGDKLAVGGDPDAPPVTFQIVTGVPRDAAD